MKKIYIAWMLGACLFASSAAMLPVRAYASVVDLTEEEEGRQEQTIVVAPEEEQSSSETQNHTTNSSSNTSHTSSTKSSDSSLSKLGISPGTLTPAFSSGIYEYTATVDESVTKVSIPATPNSSKAVIAAVTGAKNLVPGSNTVKIIVEAENGATSTYTIKVNRGGTASTTESASQTAASTEQAENETENETGTLEGVIENTEGDDEELADAAVRFDENGKLHYDGEVYVTADQVPEGDYVSLDKYNALYKQKQSQKNLYGKIIIGMAVVIVIFLFVMINLLFKIRDVKADAAMAALDEDEEKRPLSRKTVEKKVVEKTEKKTEKPEKKQTAKTETERKEPVKAETAKAEPVKKETVKKEVKKTKAKPRKGKADETAGAGASDGIEILDLNDL